MEIKLTRKDKLYWSFGFDPGINGCAWAAVRSDLNRVVCGYIKNPGDKELKAWDKLIPMLHEVENFMSNVNKNIGVSPKLWTVEAQYPGVGNPDHQTRLGWLSALAYGYGDNPQINKRFIAEPSKWTKSQKKEIRHVELLKSLPEKEKWNIIKNNKKKPTNRMWEDMTDAIGMAVWAIQQFENI